MKVSQDCQYSRFIEATLLQALTRYNVRLKHTSSISAIVEYIEMANYYDEDKAYTCDDWIVDTLENYPGEYLEFI